MAGPEKPSGAPPEQKKVPEKGQEKEARQPTPMEMIRAAVQKLEKSDIAEDLKKLMDGWLRDNIKDPTARQAYIEKVKERGKDLKIGELLEGMADTYLGAHPEINEKVQANRTEEIPKVFEGMFDVLFQDALGPNYLPGKGPAEVERVLARFKEIIR